MFCSEDALFLLFSDIFFCFVFCSSFALRSSSLNTDEEVKELLKCLSDFAGRLLEPNSCFFFFFCCCFSWTGALQKDKKTFFLEVSWCVCMTWRRLSLSPLFLSLSSLSSACSSLHVDQVFNLKAVRVYKARARFINLMCGSVL